MQWFEPLKNQHIYYYTLLIYKKLVKEALSYRVFLCEINNKFLLAKAKQKKNHDKKNMQFSVFTVLGLMHL